MDYQCIIIPTLNNATIFLLYMTNIFLLLTNFLVVVYWTGLDYGAVSNPKCLNSDEA